jgi:EmrB/QacA subfamily drug resistance transporter
VLRDARVKTAFVLARAWGGGHGFVKVSRDRAARPRSTDRTDCPLADATVACGDDTRVRATVATRPMSATDGSTVARPRSSRGLILGLVLLAQLMVVLDATIVTVALPKIQAGLHFRSQLSLQWVINAYLLLFGGFLLLGGRAGDVYGRRKLFVIGLAVFTAASFANGVAQSTGMLIAGRAAQGLGGALVAPAVLAIIVATFPETGERTKALFAFSAVSAGGGAVGLLLGGVLTQLVSWRWIFLVNIPIGIATVLLAMRFVPESRAEDEGTRTIDIPGAVTVTGGVTLLVFAVVNAQHWGWSSFRVIGVLAAATALLVAFLAIELRSRAPLIRLGIFKSRALSAANLTMFLFVSGQYATLFFPTLYMQVVLGYSPLKTGLAYLPWTVGFVAGAIAAQRLIPRIGARPTIVIGAALGAGGLILMSRLPDHGSWAGYILPGFLLNNAGGGLAFETIILVATAGVRENETGLASGIVTTSQQLGAAIGLAALAAIAASRTAHLLHSSGSPARYSHALVSGFDRGLLIAALLILAAGLVAIVAMRRIDLEQAPPPSGRIGRRRSRQRRANADGHAPQGISSRPRSPADRYTSDPRKPSRPSSQPPFAGSGSVALTLPTPPDECPTNTGWRRSSSTGAR